MTPFFERFRKPQPEADRDPDVIVDFIFEQGLLFIAISNIGFAAAYDISITFDKTINGIEGRKNMNKLPMFSDLLFLPPGKEIRTFLDSSITYFNREEPTEITCSIAFKDKSEKRFKNSIHHNLEVYKEIGYLNFAGGHNQALSGGK